MPYKQKDIFNPVKSDTGMARLTQTQSERAIRLLQAGMSCVILQGLSMQVKRSTKHHLQTLQTRLHETNT